ncbi:MAG: hypothetical protein WBB29_15475 [Geitlerinemataceae cyanobacterium]
MISNNSSTNANTDNSDESRVNYWLNYLSDIGEDKSEESEETSPGSMENLPSEFPESQDVTGLGGLGEMLLGNAGESGSNANEFELLQEILVRPEITEFRERIGQLEEQYGRIEHSDSAKEFAEIFLPLMSKLLNRKLAKLKKEIIDEMTDTIEQIIDERENRDSSDLEKQLSIRVTGIKEDAN